MDSVQILYDMCATTRVDLEKVEEYIKDHGITQREITEVAVELCFNFVDEIDCFLNSYGRAPLQSELVTQNFPDLIGIFMRHGLEQVLVRDNNWHISILKQMSWLDNPEVGPKTVKMLLDSGFDPNVMMEEQTLFEDVEMDVLADATLFEIEDEDRFCFEKEFRFWTMLFANGGVYKGESSYITMKPGYSKDIFNDYMRYDYRKEIVDGERLLLIFDKESGEVVATSKI